MKQPARAAVGSTCRGRGRRGAGAAVAPLGDGHRCLYSVDVCLLLELANIFLIANPLVAKPVGDLREAGQRLRWKPWLGKASCPHTLREPRGSAPERQ